MGRPFKTLSDRIFPRIRLTSHGCWEWTGNKNVKGYGRFWMRGKDYMSHRVIYEHFKGRVSSNLCLDHLCRNRACQNPDHLEPVTNAINLKRGESFSTLNGNKTHCHRGHEFSKTNTYLTPQGRRKCRACARLQKQLSRARQASKKSLQQKFKDIEKRHPDKS